MLVEHLTTDTQMKLYRGTVLVVLEKCGEELEIDDKVYILVRHCLGGFYVI